MRVFIHRSIKTRIETRIQDIRRKPNGEFLYIDPLKQGLKLLGKVKDSFYPNIVFIHRSIKTRIETYIIYVIYVF